MDSPRVIIVMGVAGSGKSTVGAWLAARLGGAFFDADDFHPPANVAKMAAGIPLDDADRAPWLARLRREVVDPPGGPRVLACSALKRAYRRQLGAGTPGVALVYLQGSPALLGTRIAARSGHFMKPGMLASQLATLEEPGPDEGVTVSIDASPECVGFAAAAALGLHFPPRPPE